MADRPPNQGRGGYRPGSGAPKKERRKIAFSIRVEPQLHAKIQALLEENPSLSRTELVHQALESYLSQQP